MGTIDNLLIDKILLEDTKNSTDSQGKLSMTASAKHKHESKPLIYLQTEEGGKGLVELETLYNNTICTLYKLRIASYINNSKDQHIKLVESYQLKKVQSHLSSLFKDAQKYAEELSIERDFNDSSTILQNGDKEMHVSHNKPQKVKSI